LEEISGLYAVSGELGTLLQTRFTALRISNDDDWDEDAYLEDGQEEAIGCKPESLLNLDLPDKFGQSFRTLII